MAILVVKFTVPAGPQPVDATGLITTSHPVGMLLPLPSAIVMFSVAGLAVPVMTALLVAKMMVLCMRTSTVPHTPSPPVGLAVAALAHALAYGARRTENSPVS